MATIAELRARRAAELEEEYRQQEIAAERERLETLELDRMSLSRSLDGLGLDYVLADGEAVALIEGYRVSKRNGTNCYIWHVEKDGELAGVQFWNGSERLDYLLEAFASIDARIAYRAAHPEPEQPAAPLPVPDDPFLGLEPSFGPVITIEDRVSALESVIKDLLRKENDQTVQIQYLTKRVSNLEAEQPYSATDPEQNPYIISADEAERLLALKNGSIF